MYVRVSVATAVALALSLTTLSAQSGRIDTTESTSVATAPTLAMLDGVKATPMAPAELDAIKGLHVHFITLSNGKLHIAGSAKENNWSNAWGGSDGKPVAPSYHGLCVAHGNGSIFIPTGPPGTPVTLQCPAGS